MFVWLCGKLILRVFKYISDFLCVILVFVAKGGIAKYRYVEENIQASGEVDFFENIAPN